MLLMVSSVPTIAAGIVTEEDKSWATGKAKSTFQGINLNSAKQTIPNASNKPPEADYFQDGQTVPAPAGSNKITTCRSSDTIECEAVNFVAQNPSVRPQIHIDKNDPMLVKARQAAANADEMFKSLGINKTNNECVTKTETTPGVYTDQTCSNALETTTDQCTMGRIVNINSDSNFQCDQTINATETLSCLRSPNITTSIKATCTLGEEVRAEFASGVLGGDDCWGGDKLVFSYICEMTDSPKVNIHILRDVNGQFPDSDPSTVHLSNLPPSINTSGTFSNCKYDLRGSASCSLGQCSASYTADISYLVWKYKLDNDGWVGYTDWQYSGSLVTNVPFKLYTKEATQVGWINQCTTLEARAQ